MHKIGIRRMRTLLVAAIAALVLASCQQAQEASFSLADPDAVDRVIDDFVEAGAFPFLYARLEDIEGRVIYEHGAVNNDLLPNTEIDGQTWLRIWSMSKIVTISVVLDMIEDGLLGLDDPVIRHIPEFADLMVAVSSEGEDLSVIDDKQSACPVRLVPVTSEMTVLDLLNHQAGFYYATTGIGCLDELLAAAELPYAKDSQSLVERLAALPLIQQPGTNDYYGTNTTVLGIVAERVSGKSLKQLVEQRVAGPLSIDGLQYGLPPGASLLPTTSGADGVLRAARAGELDIFGPALPDYDPQHELYLGGEGMLATVDGYADFLRMLLARGSLNGYRFLDEASIADMTAPHTQLDNPFGYNGYNLWIGSGKLSIDAEGPPGLWIGGGYEGTHFWVDPDRKFVGVVVTQIFSPPASGANRDDIIRTAIYQQLQ